MIDELKLAAFVAVAEEESFSAAADRIRVAQSTISTRIQGLETDVGQRLFVRTSRRVRLSPAGEAALPASRTALAGLVSVRQIVDDVAGIRRGRVRLGLVTGADFTPLAETLAAFTAEFPAIELVIESASVSDLEHAVSAGALDLAVVVHTDRPALRYHELMRDCLVVVGVSPVQGTVDTNVQGTVDTNVQGTVDTNVQGTVPITDICAEPLIVLDAGAGARTALESAARRAEANLNIAIQVSTPDMARDLHSRGMGALIIPRSLAPDGGSVLVDAGDDELSIHVGVIGHPDMRTPATELLWDRITTGPH